ncbi:MAG: hypothetical protein FGM46_07185, partial [Ferruginibacter sp.]|nr:hypothetical protein [Ferruginibacter sp.]
MIFTHTRKYFFLILILACKGKSQVNRSANLSLHSGNTVQVNAFQDSSCKLSSQIKNYDVSIKAVLNKNDCITLRDFTDNKSNIDYCLVLDINSLKTNIYLKSELKLGEIDSLSFKNSNYYKLAQKIIVQNYNSSGIDSTVNHGYSLTLDLCPSTKKFDQDFFDFLFNHQVAPFYVCVSGKWMEKHYDDLKYIIKKNKNDDIVWVNHSYSHYYDPSKKVDNNFMLNENTDFDVEVLNNEKLMIENGIVPSSFFRFPGLISDKKLCQKVISYGLIPLSSKAWLA